MLVWFGCVRNFGLLVTHTLLCRVLLCINVGFHTVLKCVCVCVCVACMHVVIFMPVCTCLCVSARILCVCVCVCVKSEAVTSCLLLDQETNQPKNADAKGHNNDNNIIIVIVTTIIIIDNNNNNKNNSKCSNNPYSPYLQAFFTVIFLT